MKRIRLMIVLVFLAGIGGVAAWRWLPKSKTVEKARPTVKLSVPPEKLDIGTVWEDEQFQWVLPVENDEAEPVTVQSFSASCTCTSIEPQTFTLPPGGRQEVRLKIDLTKAADASGEMAVRLTEIVKEPEPEKQRRGPQWVVRGRVRRAINLERSVFLGRHSVLAQPLASQTVTVKALVPVEALSVRSEVAGITATVKPPTGAGDYLLTIGSGRLPLGDVEGTIILTPRLKGGEQLPPVRVRVYGAIVPDVEPDPIAVQVGGRQIGEMIEETVTLRSLTGRTVRVEQVVAEGEGLSIERLSGQERFRVRQKVCRMGDQANHVRFVVTAEGHRVPVVLAVRYTGVEPPSPVESPTH